MTFPAVLSDGLNLHTCQKFQIAQILGNYATVPDAEPVADTIISDGSALVSTPPSQTVKTFEKYALLDNNTFFFSKYMTERTYIVFEYVRPILRLKQGQSEEPQPD